MRKIKVKPIARLIRTCGSWDDLYKKLKARIASGAPRRGPFNKLQFVALHMSLTGTSSDVPPVTKYVRC
jgi:hypothetical protein